MDYLLKFVGVVLAVVAVSLLVLGGTWLFWQLWLFCLGYAWPDGPASIVHIEFWPFFGFMILLSFIAGFFKR
jgi:hypothetical protein